MIIILVLIIVLVLLLTMMHKAFNPKEDMFVYNIIKKYPRHVSALLHKENISNSSQLTDEDKKKISSLSDQEWEEWEMMISQVTKLAEKYTIVFDDFVTEVVPTVYERPLAQSKGKLFVPVMQKRKNVIGAFTYAELKLILSLTPEEWEIRRKRIEKANIVKNTNAEGMKTYAQLKNKDSFASVEILRDRSFIEQLNECALLDTAYTKWEKTQEQFASQYYEVVKNSYSSCGRYIYDIKYKRQSKLGELKNSQYKMWQSFSNSFSSYHLDEQPEKYVQSYNNIAEFKSRERYFNDWVYESVFNIFKGIEEYEGNAPLVVFITNCNAEWEKNSYDYHYRRIRRKLHESNYQYCNIDELITVDSSRYSCVFIVDFLTTNEELFANCNLVVSYFGKNVPTIGYHSFIKEYSEDEILEIINKERKNNNKDNAAQGGAQKSLATEEDDINYAKQMLKKMNKHPFFAYTALVNLLIGNINGSSVVKPAWLDNPAKYSVSMSNNNGTMRCEYSTDYGSNYTLFPFSGDTHSVDNVAKFMCSLFKRMGIWNQFKMKAENAVSIINRNGYLAHH